MKYFHGFIWTIICLVFIYSCSPAANTATSNTAATIFSTHKTVAILPFQVVFANDMKQLKKFSDEEKLQLNQYFSLALQKHLYEQIIKKQKRFPYSAAFQPAEATNQILSANKISFGNIFNDSKQEYCKLLNTDAVIVPQAIFGIKESIKDMSSGGKMQMRFSIYAPGQQGAVWTYDRLSNNLFNNDLFNKNLTVTPAEIYGSDDKFERIMLPWVQAIDELFGHFTADCPYKKKYNS